MCNTQRWCERLNKPERPTCLFHKQFTLYPVTRPPLCSLPFTSILSCLPSLHCDSLTPHFNSFFFLVWNYLSFEVCLVKMDVQCHCLLSAATWSQSFAVTPEVCGLSEEPQRVVTVSMQMYTKLHVHTCMYTYTHMHWKSTQCRKTFSIHHLIDDWFVLFLNLETGEKILNCT